MAGSHGLSVWLPTPDRYSESSASYAQLDFAMRSGTGWSEFLTAFASYAPPSSSDSVTLSWTNVNGSNADFDLYVGEPDGVWYCAYDGLNTPNGSFDRDAPSGGGTSETYTWRSGATPGDYYVAVYFFKDLNSVLPSSPQATLTIAAGGQSRVVTIPAGMAPGEYVQLDSPVSKSLSSLWLPAARLSVKMAGPPAFAVRLKQ